jgi:hypothetical protein
VSFLVQSSWNLGTQLKHRLLLSLPAYCFSFGILLTYVDAARTRITENTSNVIAAQPVHWFAGWTYRKHMSRDCYPLLCDVTAYAEVCLPSRCLETGCITPLFYCCVRVLLSNGCFCGSTVLAWNKYTTVLITSRLSNSGTKYWSMWHRQCFYYLSS